MHDDDFTTIKELLYEKWNEGFAVGIVLFAINFITLALLALVEML